MKEKAKVRDRWEKLNDQVRLLANRRDDIDAMMDEMVIVMSPRRRLKLDGVSSELGHDHGRLHGS